MAALLLAGSVPAAGQPRFGQWSWDASLAAGKRSYDNRLGSQLAGSYDEGTVGLNLGVNGFLLHPSFLEFRTSVDLQVIKFGAGAARDTFRWGLRGDLRYRPRGRVPVSLYFGRHAYTYEDVTSGDPLAFAALPETINEYGGRLRVRRGFLSGLLGGYDASRLDYADPEAKRGGYRSAFLDWSRAGRRFKPSARLDWRTDEYAFADYRLGTLTGSYNHFADFGDSWRWQMSSWGVHQGLDYAASSSSNDNLRLTEILQRQTGAGREGGDLFELRYDGGVTKGGETIQNHRLLARYQWRIGRAWFVAPFAGYAFQLAEDGDTRSPEAGVQTSWQGRGGPLDLLASGSLGLRWQTPGTVASGTESTTTGDASLVAGHGTEERLRGELTVAWAANRLNVTGEPVPGLPGVVAGVGTQDSLRLRLELRRRLRGIWVSAYGERSRSNPTGTLADRLPVLDTTTGTLQVGGRRLSLTANVGDTRAAGPSEQYARFAALGATLRPLRLVSLHGSWRADRRELRGAPSVDATRLEAGADLQVGAFLVRGLWFSTSERALAGAERTNRGFNVTLARRFAGWLPIVTEAFSRGQGR